MFDWYDILWLVIGLWFGGCVGVVIAGMMVSGKISDQQLRSTNI